MRLLELTLDSTAANLALDEALLEEAEESSGQKEILRLWENPERAVIVGRSSRLEQEVCWDACCSAGVPVLRRCSGGAAVGIGPGCLMYAVVLSYERRPWLRQLDAAHQFVMDQMVAAARRLVPDVERAGICDLVVQGRKFSGNSLRCKRRFLLYHGTFLYGFPLPWLAQYLAQPPRQPEYRRGRRHAEFVTNLTVASHDLCAAVREQWNAVSGDQGWPRLRTEQLVEARYACDAWHQRRR